MAVKLIGIFGGTFDPIHLGHLAIAESLLNKTKLQEIQFIPSHSPPHRSQPCASAVDRFNMANLATKYQSKFNVNPIEINRQGESFAIETLIELKLQHPHSGLCFIIGSDAFAKLDAWHQWKKLINYCHFIVISRQGDTLSHSKSLINFINQNSCQHIEDLQESTAGKVYFADISPPRISATDIRHCLHTTKNCSLLLAPEVTDYIFKHKLYVKNSA